MADIEPAIKDIYMIHLYITAAHSTKNRTAAYCFSMQDPHKNMTFFTSSLKNTTGPQACLLALIEAFTLLEAENKFTDLAICTTQKFLVKAFSQNWKLQSRSKKSKKIQKLWNRLLPLLYKYKIRVYYMKKDSHPVIEENMILTYQALNNLEEN